MSDLDDMMDRVRDCLSEFYDELALPNDGNQGLESLAPPMDSLTAVDSLIKIDEIVGKHIPMKVIEVGGYSSKEEFVYGLTESVRAYLQEEGH